METDNSAETNVPSVQRLYFMIMLGLFLVVAGFFVIMTAFSSEGSFGGVIFIGPFPIAFGFGPSAEYMILLSLIIATIMILLFVALRRRA